MAHTASGALHFGIDEKKLAAARTYQSSPLYSTAEKAALDLAVAASSSPNAVIDVMFKQLREYCSDEQIVEIIAAIAAGVGALVGRQPTPCAAWMVTRHTPSLTQSRP